MSKTNKMRAPTPSADVARAFAAYPPRIRRHLLALRRLIFKTAAATPHVGTLTETLKWGEPAYVTTETKSGSTIRLGWKKSAPAQYALYVHCQTNLIATFRVRFPGELEFEGNRAIVFDADETPPTAPLAFCIAAALTYHRRQRSRMSS